MTDDAPLGRSRGAWWAGLAVVAVCISAPMFVGLAQWEMRSDEAIYSYAVERILETGEWLTPRSIPGDEPFYEKPPLKFWLVAGGMRLGLLPAGDAGMRGLDALAAAVMFLYLYAIGCRLGGPIAGVVSALALFSFDDILVEHGLRSNNMEAALVLAYTAAFYHALRWAEAESAGVPAAQTWGGGAEWRGRHAYAIAGWFVLGFLTKFVAALFLPLVVVLTIASRPAGLRDLLGAWRTWLAPIGVALVLIAPWFIYQTVHAGREFWTILLTAHVLQRFAGVLHPEHLHPWYYYASWLWQELGREGLRVTWVAGLAALAWRGLAQGEWRVRAVLLWWAVPFVLISAGTSKLFHYAYPFLPPLALGVGLAVALGLGALASAHWSRLWGWPGVSTLGSTGPALARVLTVVGGVAFLLGAWAVMVGPVTLQVGGVRLFRSAILWRPALIGAVLWLLAGQGSRVLRPLGALLSVWLLFPTPYSKQLAFLMRTDHPLRTMQTCAREVASIGGLAPGVFHASGDLHHAYYFYLRHLGWTPWHTATPAELQRRLEMPGQQTPVILGRADYVRLGGRLPASAPAPVATTTGAPPVSPDPPLTEGLPPGVLLSDDAVLLFPRPYDGCADVVMRDAVAATRLPAQRLPPPAPAPSTPPPAPPL
jgi:4-amino-4-deoxy-L-arabinose transferase-like glycosyltransferase